MYCRYAATDLITVTTSSDVSMLETVVLLEPDYYAVAFHFRNRRRFRVTCNIVHCIFGTPKAQDI